MPSQRGANGLPEADKTQPFFQGAKGSLASRANIVTALILRDMRTRFGRSHLGYLIAIGWPFVHLSVLVGIMAFVNRLAPIGGDPAVYVSTGVLPYILCLYPARMMGIALDLNRSLFLFPVLSTFDIIIARAVVEFMTAFVVVILVFIVGASIGVDLMPLDNFVLASGVVTTILLSLAMGLVNVVMASLFGMWHIVFVLLMVIMYMGAGVFVPPSFLPPDLQYYMWFNPLFHSVEWIRSAYYEGYGDENLSKSYLIWTTLICFLLGLMGERFLRGKLLSG